MVNTLKDVTEFDRNLSDLFASCKKIVKTNEKHNLKLSSNRNPILSGLERYVKVYDRTDPEEHVFPFNQIYENNTRSILRGPHRDGWISTGSIIIKFSEKTKIHLSVIYNISCKLRDDIRENSRGLPNSNQAKELIYPDEILLNLYRIFYELTESEEDQTKLSEHIKELEDITGSKKSKSKSSDDDGFGGLIETATGMMEQFGIKLPDGQKLPSSQEVSEQLKGAMSNPQISSMFGNMMKEMQGCNNIGDVVGKALGQLNGSGIDTSALGNMLGGSQGPTQSVQSSPNNENVEVDHGDNEDFDDFIDGDFSE